MQYNVKIRTGFLDGTMQIKTFTSLMGRKDNDYQDRLNKSDYEPTEEELEQRQDKSKRDSLTRARRTIFDLIGCNRFILFATFTFDDSKVKADDYKDCVTKLTNYLTNQKRKLKRRKSELSYIVVPEQHKDNKRWHFHACLYADNEQALKDSLKLIEVGQTEKGMKVYKIGSWNWSNQTRAEDIWKQQQIPYYLTKNFDEQLFYHLGEKKRYYASRNLKKPIELKLLTNVNDLEMYLDSKNLKKKEDDYKNWVSGEDETASYYNAIPEDLLLKELDFKPFTDMDEATLGAILNYKIRKKLA